MNAAPLNTGDLVDGKLYVDSLLGSGNFGMVYKAIHLGLNQPVALKVLINGGPSQEERKARFLREGRIAAALRSPHVAGVRDLGTLPSGDLYLVMDFLDGRDLAAVLKERGPLPVEEAVSFIVQACHAIAEAHEAGIIHRDIKPSNLFLHDEHGRSPRIKVVDFGIAKQDDGVGLTQTGAALGSPLYMSPEAVRGLRDLDARADIWSLGATLYELLSQAQPFPGTTVPEVAARIVLEEPRPLLQHRPDIPPQLAAVVMQCFEKEPSRRWPTVADLAAALAPFGPPNLLEDIARLARAQHRDVAPSRPTAELSRPTDSALDRAIAVERAAVEARTAAAAQPEATATPARPRRSGRALAAGAAVVALVMPTGLYVGLRGHGEAASVAGSSSSMVGAAPSASASAKPIEPIAEPAPSASSAVAAEPVAPRPSALPIPKPTPRPAPPPPKPRKDPYKQ